MKKKYITPYMNYIYINYIKNLCLNINYSPYKYIQLYLISDYP